MSDHSRVVSGMRTTGQMHLGHLHGALNNWVSLQHDYDCYFFAADWHALTTHYDSVGTIQKHAHDMIVDWLSVGLNPHLSTLFVQSEVPEHAELHLLLSMITPNAWLERVPTYKDQQEKLSHKDLSTYGFLGYPLLQSADVLVYRGSYVPVGEDQVPHIELTREIARRFNHIFGRDDDFVEKAEQAIQKLGKKTAKVYRQLMKRYQESGDDEALETGLALVKDSGNLSLNDSERLIGYLDGSGRTILPEPQALLTKSAKMPGIDGQKMSKSYNNCIYLRDNPEMVERKVATMPTDPARVKRTDPGTPEKCPVWELHQVYSDAQTQGWVQEGCKTAGIGCLDCKRPIIDAMQKELAPIHEARTEYDENPSMVKGILRQGAERARDEAKKVMDDVREAVGLA